jgi:ribosomal protein S12 methylthiotransferase accessory factor
MISLEQYLKKNNQEKKFEIPFSFFGKLKHEVIRSFLLSLPFKHKIFIDSPYGFDLDFEIVFSFVKKYFGLNMGKRFVNFGIGTFGFKSNMYFEVKNGKNDFLMHGHASSLLSQKEADSKALGEFLERYVSSYPDDMDLKNLKKVSWKDFLTKTKNLRDYHNFSFEQSNHFKNFNLNPDKLLGVLPVYDLLNKTENLYPMQQIFWNKDYLIKEEGMLASATTSGCAGGFTFEMATLNAIYELIERDSFMCFWLTKTNPTRIHLEKGVSETFDLALNFLNLSHYELFVLDITTDLKIPSVLCVIKGKVNNAIMIAASSKETLLDAIESAVLEVMSCGVMSNQEKFFELDLDTPVYLNTKISRDERVNFWIHRGSTAGLDFLLNENKILKITKENQGEFSKKENDSDKIKLDKLLTKLKGEGEKIENIYVYEFKNKYIEKIGFKVVRVVIPYLYPIYLFEYTKLSLSKRLDDFNLSKSGTKVFELNQEIHPFP